MSRIASDALQRLDHELRHIPSCPKSYANAGMVGNAAHTYGYHISANDIGGRWDYSLQLNADKIGGHRNPNLVAAWDLHFNPRDMRLVTQRLLTAAKRHDPRMNSVREFCGTLNGRQTYPWDLHTNSCEGVDSWDDSHLSHVHISFYRDRVISYDAMKGVLEVICGINVPRPRKPVKPKYPGTLHVGSRGHAVLELQHQLQHEHYAPHNDGWADGYYGPQTAEAVKLFKRKHHWHVTGNVGRRMWGVLFK